MLRSGVEDAEGRERALPGGFLSSASLSASDSWPSHRDDADSLLRQGSVGGGSSAFGSSPANSKVPPSAAESRAATLATHSSFFSAEAQSPRQSGPPQDRQRRPFQWFWRSSNFFRCALRSPTPPNSKRNKVPARPQTKASGEESALRCTCACFQVSCANDEERRRRLLSPWPKPGLSRETLWFWKSWKAAPVESLTRSLLVSFPSRQTVVFAP